MTFPSLHMLDTNIAFNNDARNVGVEHMERRESHSAQLSNGLRGAAGCLRSSIKLAGIIVLASRSKNPCHGSGLRDKTTSPVFESRRIKTSVPSNRYSIGSRTAWLRPVVKSFAVVDIASLLLC